MRITTGKAIAIFALSAFGMAVYKAHQGTEFVVRLGPKQD